MRSRSGVKRVPMVVHDEVLRERAGHRARCVGGVGSLARWRGKPMS